jgi:RNA polymerase sigma-70 factor (ECF subfamily)
MASDAICPLPTVERSTREQDEALEAIYRAHAAALRGRLLAMTREPAVADDLVSEAFIRLATQIRAGRTPEEPPAWLYRVGANLVVSRARRASVANRALPGLVRRDDVRSPEEEVLDRERDGVLHDALGALADSDREIVVLAARGYRPEEIAGIIGRSGPATRTRLCRARGRLRSRLEVAGMTA